MRKATVLSLFALLLFALSFPAVQSARADTLDLSLANPVQNAVSGSTLSFIATVSAPSSNTGTLYLNGDIFNVDSPIALNDDGFFTNFPFSLDPGQSYTGLLFTLTIPADAAPAIYTGSFGILGGAGDLDQDVLATTSFQANVTPEPASFLLLGTGLIGIACFFTMRQRRVPQF